MFASCLLLLMSSCNPECKSGRRGVNVMVSNVKHDRAVETAKSGKDGP